MCSRGRFFQKNCGHFSSKIINLEGLHHSALVLDCTVNETPHAGRLSVSAAPNTHARFVLLEARQRLHKVPRQTRLDGAPEDGLGVPVAVLVVLQLVHPLLLGHVAGAQQLEHVDGGGAVDMTHPHGVEQTEPERLLGLVLHRGVHKTRRAVLAVKTLEDVHERRARAHVRVLLHAVAAHVAAACLGAGDGRGQRDAFPELLLRFGEDGVRRMARVCPMCRGVRHGVPRCEEAVAQEHVRGAAVGLDGLHRRVDQTRVRGGGVGGVQVHEDVEVADVHDDDADAALPQHDAVVGLAEPSGVVAAHAAGTLGGQTRLRRRHGVHRRGVGAAAVGR
eukprot:PhM_4_TR13901/c2_g1_i13/m.96098